MLVELPARNFVLIVIAKIVIILFGFIKRVDKGRITNTKDLGSFHNVLMANALRHYKYPVNK